MKTTDSKSIAYSAIGASISLLSVILSYYIGNLTLFFTILAAIGVMLPITKGYYKGAILLTIGVTLLGALLINVKILPFALITGSYTVFTIFFDEKIGKKPPKIVLYIIKFLYSCFVFFVLFQFFKLISVDKDSSLGKFLEKTTFSYIILNAVWSVAFLIYDYLLLWNYRYLKNYLKKLFKS